MQSYPALEASINRPKAGASKKLFFKSIPYKGAVLTHGLICSHPFCNGNKRVALASTILFFELNGFYLNVKNKEIVPFLMKIAKHEVDIPGISHFYGEKLITAKEWQNHEMDKILWIDKKSPEGKHKIKQRKYIPKHK